MRTACLAPRRCHARNRQDTAQQECRLTTARDEDKTIFLSGGSDRGFALQSMVVRSERLELSRVLPHSDLNAARLPFRHDRTPWLVGGV